VKTAWQTEKGRIGNDAAFSMSYARREGWGDDPVNGNWKGKNAASNGDDEEVRKLNPNLIDPAGTPLHVGCGRMTQHRQEKRNDVGG
jgi:hypothetical protein